MNMHGRDIAEIPLNELIKDLERLVSAPDQPQQSFRVTFLRNVTIDPLIPYLKHLCYAENLKPDIDLGNYDQVLQDVRDPANIERYASSDLIVLWLYGRSSAKRLYSNFASLESEAVRRESEELLGRMEELLGALRRITSAPILVHNFEIPAYPTFGVLDTQDPFSQVGTIRRMNQELLALALKYPSVHILDVELLVSRLGEAHFVDERFWHMAKAPYTRQGFLLIAEEYLKFIRALRGKTKKCLVLDCDNTLWGGIIGEDGLEGIKIGHTYPGSSYREFQESILELHHRGVLLAVCSKNNPNDVEEVFEKHPDMVLRREHFVAWKVNWQDKVTSLRQIAAELGIGLDSLVFVDDNEFEINMVREMAPEITAVLLPKEPSNYRRTLERPGFFDVLAISEEDRKRTQMYQAEAKRREAKEQFAHESLEDYLKYLEMRVTVAKANAFYVPRISQLTQRTNQFNLTTQRYSEAEITELVRSEKSDVLYLTLSDRFGDNGLVGAAILRYEAENAFIDSFLLSCRILGRGAEEVLLKVCVDEARQRGSENIFGAFLPTKKNQQVADFYDKHHFAKISVEPAKTTYMLSLGKAHMAFPAYFKLIKVGDIEYLKEVKGNE